MNRSRPFTMLAGTAAAPLIALAVAACGNGGGGASALPTAPPERFPVDHLPAHQRRQNTRRPRTASGV